MHLLAISLALTLISSQVHSLEAIYPNTIVQSLSDADRDGVIKARDLCPNTAPQLLVDNDGCEIQVQQVMRSRLDVQFATNRHQVRPQFFPSLIELGKFLQEHSQTTVIIEGHTDNVGDPESNRMLSQKRADAIAEVLIDKFKIDSSRVKTIGYGETRPVSSNDDEQGRFDNRRVIAEVFHDFSSEQTFSLKQWSIYQKKNTLDMIQSRR